MGGWGDRFARAADHIPALWLVLAASVTAVRLFTLPLARRCIAGLIVAAVLGVPLSAIPRDRTLWAPLDDEDEASDDGGQRAALAAEDAFYLQPKLLERELAALRRGRKGVIDLYFVGVAGDAQQPPATLATPGTAVIFLAPAQPAPGAKPGPDLARTIILPVIRALSSAQVPVVVGEDGSSPLPLLAQVRQDSSLRVVTVDTVDQSMGQAAVVLGLAEALTTNAWGAYGSGAGASAALPTPPAPAAPTPSPSLSASLSRK